MQCEHCPLNGTDKTCPSKGYPSYCRHIARERQIPTKLWFWTPKLLKEANEPEPPRRTFFKPIVVGSGDQWSTEEPSPNTIVIRQHNVAHSGYFHMILHIGKEIEAAGYKVVLESIGGVDEHLISLPEWARERIRA